MFGGLVDRTNLSFSVYDIPDVISFWRERESTDFLCSGKHHLSDFVVKNEQVLLSKRRVPGSLSCLTKGIHHHFIPLVCRTYHWGRGAYYSGTKEAFAVTVIRLFAFGGIFLQPLDGL